MVCVLGRGFSEEDRRVLWARWRAGGSLSEIARLLGKSAGSIFNVVQGKGALRRSNASEARAI